MASRWRWMGAVLVEVGRFNEAGGFLVVQPVGLPFQQ